MGHPPGVNFYTYALNNPIRYKDPSGNDIAVIENGPTSGNPVGHTAIAITGAGVYSFGNTTLLGSNLSDYLYRQSSNRDTNVYLIHTTPAQDVAALKYLRSFPDEKLRVDFLAGGPPLVLAARVALHLRRRVVR